MFAILLCVGAERVAIVLGGPHRGTNVSAAELRRAVVEPLSQNGMDVHIWAAGFVGHRDKDEDHEAAWRSWLEEAVGHTNATAHFVALPIDEELLKTYPQHAGYLSTCADSQYHKKFLHTSVAWAAAQLNGTWDYLIKTRDDLAFGYGQVVKPCWLREVQENVVLAANKEHHQGGYWYEAGGWLYASVVPSEQPGSVFKSWQNPGMIMDQFWLGKADTVGRLVNFVKQPPNALPCHEGSPMWSMIGKDYPAGPEAVIADYLWRAGISFYPVSLSLFKLVSNETWALTQGGCRTPPVFRGNPCQLCFDCFAS